MSSYRRIGLIRPILPLIALVAVAAPLGLSAGPALATDYQVGDVLIYDNPYDDVPARRGRVTKHVDGQVWVDFSEFTPGLSITEASTILFEGTNTLDDWARPDGAGDEIGAVPDDTAVPAPMADPAQTVDVATAGSLTDLFGLWSTLQVGHTVLTEPGDGYIYQKQEIAAQAGTIAINSNGTFLWNSVSEGVIEGSWRPLSADEIRSEGGRDDRPGIRLTHGEGGWDYNVQLGRETGILPPGLVIWTEGYQVNAYRME
jgi:hypothetical protein